MTIYATAKREKQNQLKDAENKRKQEAHAEKGKRDKKKVGRHDMFRSEKIKI